jgi:molecular chaperone HscB
MPVTDFFAILDMPAGCQLDRQLLDEQYRKRQAVWHPDRFVNASESAKRQALQQTSLLNDAYNILKHPLRRAEHLLDLRLCESGELAVAKLEPEFLLQQLQWREELEQLDEQRDEPALASLRQRVEAALARHWLLIEADIARHDWCAARLSLQKLQFLNKLQEELNHLEDRWLEN